MSSSPVNLRNLERIHESSPGSAARLSTYLLAATGVSALIVVALALREEPPTAEPIDKDPLLALIERAKQEDGASDDETSNELGAAELDFPELLSDADLRTTALVAVKDQRGRLVPLAESETKQPIGNQLVASEDAATAGSPPPPTDQIPVVPLPAGSELAATSITRQPKDELTQLAAHASALPSGQTLAEAGSEGGFLVQVASFKEQADADQFVIDLRKRGHKAFRQAANVPGRGLWHRVRIGSFRSKYEATLYKKKLEKTERTIALVIDPAKVERAQKVRAAKLAERIRKYGSD